MSAIQSNRPEKDAKNRVPLTRKFQWESCPTTHWYFLQKKFTILECFAKSFLTKRKPSKCPTREKKGAKKSKRSGEERILLFAHARTLKAVIWHLEQKLVQCSTCKQRFGQLGFFLARQRPENGLTRFKRHFLAKCPGVKWFNNIPNYIMITQII